MARPSTPQPQYLFLEPFFRRSKLSTAIKLEGEGGLGLNGQAIYRRTFFCGFPQLTCFLFNACVFVGRFVNGNILCSGIRIVLGLTQFWVVCPFCLIFCLSYLPDLGFSVCLFLCLFLSVLFVFHPKFQKKKKYLIAWR